MAGGMSAVDVKRVASVAAAFGLFALLAEAGAAQDTVHVASLEARPAEIEVVRGESVRLVVLAFDADGNPMDAVLRVGGARGSVEVRDGRVRGLAQGEHTVIVSAVTAPEGDDPVELRVPVRVLWPRVEGIQVLAEHGSLFQGSRLQHEAEAFHGDGTRRPNVDFRWSSSNPSVATVDRFGRVRAVGTGAVTITAEFEGRSGSIRHEVRPPMATSLEIVGGQDEVRVGDAQDFRAVVGGVDGAPLTDVPVTWSYFSTPHDSIKAPGGTAFQKGGRIVVDVPGVYTVVATTGRLTAERSFEARPRNVVQEVQVVGAGRLPHVYTTDLWVFRGVDGRDYAITGSKRVGGKAYFWDVTEPSNPVLADSIQVDARTVNDVKVSPDGRYAALSREGASNRRNGVVLVDLADPKRPRVASTFDEGLTGGVHNVFATDEYLFAVSNGEKYLILDVRDIYEPRYVSEYDHPDSRIHDVWVHGGIAYSSEWGTGVVMVDVGDGRWGGSPENPVLIGSYALPSGRTHAVFPYASESTDRFYLFVGDEILNREGLAWRGNGPNYRELYDPETGEGGYPRATSGYIQVVDATDPENLEMVARYEVREYGTHNMWVDDDKLYQAYYEGGLRVVDVSGELMGNLYTQNREIAVFKPNDPMGRKPNSPGTWGTMPYKGYIFFSDINSGLWAVKLQPEGKPVT